MKTNPAARSLVKVRFLLLCVSLAAIFGLEVYLGASFAARVGQIAVIQTDTPAAPPMDLSDLMAAAP
jgi:hypothetical protein